MKQKLYQVDTFTQELFKGNPAAVCILENWLPDILMQQIAAENNLAETAFAVAEPNGYLIRWFTPTTEVALCGHATLATAHVLFNHYDYAKDEILFSTQSSGTLGVSKFLDGSLVMDFPRDTLEKIPPQPELEDALGAKALETYKGATDFLLVYDSEKIISSLDPDMNALAQIKDCRGVIVTAQGKDTDFVSRFFAPQSGIPEDPVTGSAHTTLAPYWGNCLGKTELTAQQLSARGGNLICTITDNRVALKGHAITYLCGTISI